MPSSTLESQLADQIKMLPVPPPEREFQFSKDRQWRFDFAWPEFMVAVEVEGATWSRGRHTRGKGFEADCKKYNQAAIDGWTVLRMTGGMIRSGIAINQVEQAVR